MNRVADKNGILAATRYRETAVCGSGEGASSPHQSFAHREPMSTARRATQVACDTLLATSSLRESSRRQPIPHRRFLHRVLAVVIVAPTIRCGRAVWSESGGSGLSRTKGLRPTVSRPLCQGAQHSEHPFLLQPIRALTLLAVCGVRLLMKQLAIRLNWQTTPTKSLVIAKGMAIRVSPHLNPLPLAGEEAFVLSPAYGGKLERGLAFLAYSLADTLPRSGRLREARRGRYSRTRGSRPPCHAAYPAKPSARPCGT